MVSSATLDVDYVRGLVTKVDSGVALAAELRADILDVLEQHECWGPFFRLLRSGKVNSSPTSERDFVRLARVQNIYLEDAFAAAETCATMVSELRPSYLRFSEEILPQVIDFEDFVTEATILSSVCDFLPAAADNIACLERLCMLYEKKTHNETQLVKTYEKLLSIDAANVKALRYFKLLFTQGNEWEQVVETLKKLLKAVHHPQELFRVAQELAAIYLYQLDMPLEAIRVLDAHCADSPLDTSTILFDAYQRLADWQGCLRVLRQCLLTVDAEGGRAILHHKIGTLNLQLGDSESALDNFTKAVRLSPRFLDAIEGVINVGVQRKDWDLINTWLGALADDVVDERLRAQIKQAQSRLSDGLSHAAQRP